MRLVANIASKFESIWKPPRNSVIAMSFHLLHPLTIDELAANFAALSSNTRSYTLAVSGQIYTEIYACFPDPSHHNVIATSDQ